MTTKDEKIQERLKEIDQAYKKFQGGDQASYDTLAEEDPEGMAVYHTERVYELVHILAKVAESLPEGKAADMIATLVEVVIIMNMIMTANSLWTNQLERRIEALEGSGRHG